jgi:hypothetical protein
MMMIDRVETGIHLARFNGLCCHYDAAAKSKTNPKRSHKRVCFGVFFHSPLIKAQEFAVATAAQRLMGQASHQPSTLAIEAKVRIGKCSRTFSI